MRLFAASLDEQFLSLRLLERTVDWAHQTAIEDELAKDIGLAAKQCRAMAPEMWALKGEIGGLREVIAASGAKLKEHFVSIERQMKDNQREAPAIADVRNVVGPLGARLQAFVEENCCQVLARAEM